MSWGSWACSYCNFNSRLNSHVSARAARCSSKSNVLCENVPREREGNWRRRQAELFSLRLDYVSLIPNWEAKLLQHSKQLNYTVVTNTNLQSGLLFNNKPRHEQKQYFHIYFSTANFHFVVYTFTQTSFKPTLIFRGGGGGGGGYFIFPTKLKQHLLPSPHTMSPRYLPSKWPLHAVTQLVGADLTRPSGPSITANTGGFFFFFFPHSDQTHGD